MNILMVSTSYPRNTQDWRGRFIDNLASALARRNEIALSLWAPPGELPVGVLAAASPGDARWLENLSDQGGIAHLLRKRRIFAATAVVQLLVRLGRIYRHRQVDVVHVNWLQNALAIVGYPDPGTGHRAGQRFRFIAPSRNENIVARCVAPAPYHPGAKRRLDATRVGA